MSSSTGRRRPALAPSLALLTGAVVGWHSPASAQAVTVAATLFGAMVALCAGRRSRVPPTLLPLFLLFACGALGAIGDRSLRLERARRAFPNESAPMELHLRGHIVRGPEVSLDGERVIVVRGRPEQPSHAGYDGDLVVRLTVRASPPEPTRALDALTAGDGIRVWCRLFRPRGNGNPGARDPATSLAARGLDALGTVKSARLVEPCGPSASIAQGLLGGVRRLARSRLDVVFGEQEQQRALAGAMLLGDRAALDPTVMRRLRAAGLIHLVAISGLHVGLLGCVVVFLLERMRLPALLRVALVVSFLLGFGHLVGLRPSVVRAAIAVSVIVAGRLVGRRGEPLNALALIAAGLVACAPARIFDAGLQLTFAATAGILVCASGTHGNGRRERWIDSGVIVSSSAYLATAPMTAWHFGWLAPICLISNLAALPLCALILATGYLSILVAHVPIIGVPIGGAVRVTTGLLLSLADLAADVERGGFAVARPHPAILSLYYAVGLAWLSARRRLPDAALRTLALGFALCVLAIHAGPPPSPHPALMEAAVIDVGQGQSIAVRGRRGRTVVVDAAGSASARFDPGERIVLPFLLASSGRRIDSMILSHDHLDHVGGALALLREMEVGELCLPPAFHRSHPMSRIAGVARDRGAALRLCEWGSRFEVGEIPVRAVAPRRTDLAPGSNDRSVVVVLGRFPYRLLIPGDIEVAGERRLMASPLPLSAEALVLSHHGSFSGTSRPLLSRVKPHQAIASCGSGNRFGHPHPAVCRRVRRARATLWRTDLDGLVRLDASGGEWKLASSRRGR